jgi:uncharacterized iron-regulated membrane protein
MRLFRSVLFWTHLTAGVLASVVIFVMSFTGAVLALRPQIQDWIERDVRRVTPADSPRLRVHQMFAAVKEARPDASPQSLNLSSNPETAATVNLGREGILYVNPYTGAILGGGSARTNQFFQSMTAWHRYMGAAGEYRATGRSATGISNLAFLVLGITGLYIWWPKQVTLKHLKPILWFRRTTTGRARDFNWHNTLGFWCAIPIVIMTASGAVLSYSWASNLVYRITGSPVPAGRAGDRGGSRGRAADAQVARPGPDAARAEGGRRAPESNQQGPAAIPAELDRIWARAEQQIPTWSLLSMRLPDRDGGPITFSITDGAHWNAFARSSLTLNSATGETVQWQPYGENSLGQKARGWLRFAHTGELGGLPGQIAAGLACLGSVFLVYTGLSLAFRRLWHWSLWKRLRASTREREPLGEVSRQAVMD